MRLVKILKAMLLSVAVIHGAAVQAQTPTTPVKWNPGHYIQLGGKAGDWLVEDTFKTISTMPNVRGVQIREAWSQLEPVKGVYNFSEIDKALAYAETYNKRLWLFLGTKAFTPGGKAVPDYMYSGEYGQVAYKITINAKETLEQESTQGENIALYNDAVRDRLVLLMNALGERYNKHNRFEGVAFNETAMGRAATPLTEAQKVKWFKNLSVVHVAARKAFPNTVVLQFVNFPQPYTTTLVSDMAANGTALGGPDTFLAAEDLEKSTYPFYEQYKGILPMGPSVQGENYIAEYQFGPFVKVDTRKIYEFAKTRLNANYIFWNRASTFDGYTPFNEVLRMLKAEDFPQWAAGGLATGCPAVYHSCVRMLK